jgi:hypothetical protein
MISLWVLVLSNVYFFQDLVVVASKAMEKADL